MYDEQKAVMSCLALPECLPQVKASDIQTCLKAETPTLATVRLYHGERVTHCAISEILVEAAELLNVGNNLTAAQVNALSEMIFRDWYWYTLADLKTMLQMGIKGEFGKIYERLDVNVIYEWLMQYNEKRAAVAEQNSSNAKQIEVVDGGEPMPEWMSDWIKKFEKHVNATARMQEAKTSFQYTSLEQYCDLNDLDYGLSLSTWAEAWGNDYNELQPSMELSEWVEYCKAQTLFEINNPR